MGGDHGHHESFKIPDWKIYKVEECPKLVQVQKALASQGLKDPWLRNEAWRYHPGFGTERIRARLTFTRGIQWGFAAFLLTLAYESIRDSRKPSSHGHGHGHH